MLKHSSRLDVSGTNKYSDSSKYSCSSLTFNKPWQRFYTTPTCFYKQYILNKKNQSYVLHALADGFKKQAKVGFSPEHYCLYTRAIFAQIGCNKHHYINDEKTNHYIREIMTLYNLHGAKVFNTSPIKIADIPFTESEETFYVKGTLIPKQFKLIKDNLVMQTSLLQSGNEAALIGSRLAWHVSLYSLARIYNEYLILPYKNLYDTQTSEQIVTLFWRETEHRLSTYIIEWVKILQDNDKADMGALQQGWDNYLRQQETLWEYVLLESKRITSLQTTRSAGLTDEHDSYRLVAPQAHSAFYQAISRGLTTFSRPLEKHDVEKMKKHFQEHKDTYTSIGTIARFLGLAFAIVSIWWTVYNAKENQKKLLSSQIIYSLIHDVNKAIIQIEEVNNELFLSMEPLQGRNLELLPTDSAFENGESTIFKLHAEFNRQIISQLAKLDNLLTKLHTLKADSELAKFILYEENFKMDLHRLTEKIAVLKQEAYLLIKANEGITLFERRKIYSATKEIDETCILLDQYMQHYTKGSLSYSGEAKGKILKIFAATLYNTHALILERAFNFDRAREHYLKALEAVPSHPTIVANYAMLVINSCRADLADFFDKQATLDELNDIIIELIRANRARPDSAHTLNTMGWSYYIRGRYFYSQSSVEQGDSYKRADKLFEKALALSPLSPRILYNRARLFIDMGQYEKAIDNLATALVTKAIDCDYMGFELANIKMKLNHPPDEINSLLQRAKIYYLNTTQTMIHNAPSVKLHFYSQRLAYIDKQLQQISRLEQLLLDNTNHISQVSEENISTLRAT